MMSWCLCWLRPFVAAMSLAGHTSDSAPLFSSDSEADGLEEHSRPTNEQEAPASGVSALRALLTVLVLCYINLLNYMDRFTVAGKGGPRRHPRASPLS